MKLAIQQENLKKALAQVSRAVPGKPVMPILSNVLLTTDQGRLRLSATDLNLAITVWTGTQIEQDGSVLVPAGLFADLIAGLPGESLASFGEGFDKLVRLGPHEIQVGVLKRLRGTPIIRHTDAFAMRYNPEPPYNVLATAAIDFPTLRRVDSFAYHWERIANSGRFVDSLAWITSGDSAFAGFMEPLQVLRCIGNG